MTDNQLKLMQLRNYQALPLGGCIRRSEMLIREAMERYGDMMYIALSAGKDSCTMADIVWSIFPDVPAVFCDTGNELDSVLEHLQSMIDDGRPIIIIKPSMTFDEVVEKFGYPILSKNICMGISRFVNTKSLLQKKLRAFGGINPTSGKKQQRTIPKKFHYILRLVLSGKLRVTNKCCGILKINPTKPYMKATGRHPFVGTMAGESKNRLESYMKLGCNAFEGEGISRPLMFWTEQHILQYHVEKKLPMASAYGEIESYRGKLKCSGEQRTGCKLCLFGIHLEPIDRPNRIQRLYIYEPETYYHCIVNLHYDEVMDVLGVEWRPFIQPDIQQDLFDPSYETEANLLKENHGH